MRRNAPGEMELLVKAQDTGTAKGDPGEERSFLEKEKEGKRSVWGKGRRMSGKEPPPGRYRIRQESTGDSNGSERARSRGCQMHIGKGPFIEGA